MVVKESIENKWWILYSTSTDTHHWRKLTIEYVHAVCITLLSSVLLIHCHSALSSSVLLIHCHSAFSTAVTNSLKKIINEIMSKWRRQKKMTKISFNFNDLKLRLSKYCSINYPRLIIHDKRYWNYLDANLGPCQPL